MLLSAPEQVISNYTEQGAEIVLRCPGCFGSDRLLATGRGHGD